MGLEKNFYLLEKKIGKYVILESRQLRVIETRHILDIVNFLESVVLKVVTLMLLV